MIRFFSFIGIFAFSVSCLAAQAQEKTKPFPRPTLQVFNGSSDEIQVFWLAAGDERVMNSSIAPGKSTQIKTTLGHRFVIVGKDEANNPKEIVVESQVTYQGIRFDSASPSGIPAFYTQAADVNGFPIVASAAVSPYALAEAKFLVTKMLANRQDVLEAITKSGARLHIMAYNEFTTDLPEFKWLGESLQRDFPQLDPKDYWDARARGTGGSQTDPYCSCAEENLLGYAGDPYSTECILIHEFAHCIHLRGMCNIDPTFDDRLKETYEQAMQQGLWKGKYASVNHHEYFAEGVQSWFDDNREDDHDHNHVNTREELLAYDSGLAALCKEVFGETAIQYTKPVTRLTEHLAGYDSSKSPIFQWPARLKNAQKAIREHVQQRNDQANSAATLSDKHEVRKLVGWTLYIHPDLRHATKQAATDRALELLTAQLKEITRVVPDAAVAKLKTVPLWFSPEYPNVRPGAEYHPGASWLKENNRDPVMVKGVEFTNIDNFEAETRRMPNFALHELAHAYHDQFLEESFRNPQLRKAFESAKASGKYDNVERQDSEGNKRQDRAYAMTNPQEYFAESTEAFFTRNDFFPYDYAELLRHDPEMCKLLTQLWGVTDVPPAP
jgi:hypothetical protein